MTTPLVILAGGRAARMGGGDKCLLAVGGIPILRRILDRLARPHRPVVLNANGDPGRFAAYGLPVVPDGIAEQPGPLAGILAGMRWVAANLPDARDIVTVSGDTPFLPADLVERLVAARAASGADIAVAASAGRTHHTAALWPVGLADALEHAIREEGIRRVGAWAARHRVAVADFACDPVDPFLNVNDPAGLAEAERFAASAG
ncbi:molybdopterin-guanine dinucleotide biosynthesis protein A [Constrictibacter sp. MBR-5]|jgi:molybdopterin-guanine dinucleotide biosynthesis protein A|uniref:molybdenum cofactor guanylyltransferase MobA n=1 Tax=Constrictibacter sp. MBR-5 TaxID=3156467 RepID=UPI003393FBDA